MTTRETLFIRDESSDSMSPTVVSLLIALLVVAIVAVLAATALAVLKFVRVQRESRHRLPTHKHPSDASTLSPPTARRSNRGHRRTISITTHPAPRHLPAFSLAEEKEAFMNSPTTAPPRSGVPEIHITFPDEDKDTNEKRHSGRVVVVRISDNGGIGLAPYLDSGAEEGVGEGLPPYQIRENGEFMSLDLERLGGLREKNDKLWG